MDTLQNEVFASDIEWALPGHHPLSGVKFGAAEVIAFFGALMETGINVDNLSFGRSATTASSRPTAGTAPSTVASTSSRRAACTRSATARSRTSRSTPPTSTGVDAYFWRAYKLKPSPTDLQTRKEPIQWRDGATGPMATIDKMYACLRPGDMGTLKSDVFAPDIEWALPGHHPLSGVKKGADEVIAFFGALMETGINVDNLVVRDDRRRPRRRDPQRARSRRRERLPVPDVQRLHDPRRQDQRTSRSTLADQHGVDDYFWRAYKLKPLPERLTH